MRKYIRKFMKYFRKSTGILLSLLAISLLPQFNLFIQNEISTLMAQFGLTGKNIGLWLFGDWYRLPVLLGIIYFALIWYLVFTEPKWNDVTFQNVNSPDSSFPFARIQVENENDDNLEKCKVELVDCKLVNDFRDDEDKYHYQFVGPAFPVTLAWLVDGKEIYNPIDIDRNGKSFILVAVSDPADKKIAARFCTNIKEGSPIISMRAGEYRITLQIFARLKDDVLKPKVLTKTLFFREGHLLLTDNK